MRRKLARGPGSPSWTRLKPSRGGIATASRPITAIDHVHLEATLINDLFGIQTRGGCSCAGPYGHRLLGIDPDQSHKFEAEIAKGCDIEPPLRLSDISYSPSGSMDCPRHDSIAPVAILQRHLDEARRIFAQAPLSRDNGHVSEAECEKLRWFELPKASLRT